MQKFKSVYFADRPASSNKGRNLKIAFGPSDGDIFARISLLSSEEVRRLLGSPKYLELKARADNAGVALNSFCLQQLRAVAEPPNGHQYVLPEVGTTFDIDPIQTTFRGGRHEPLQNWYPYLEGYSPEFVQNSLAAFAPNAHHILDPFAGCGTTPLTALRQGLKASYCELNPLMQYLIEAKSSAIAAPIDTRRLWADELHEMSSRLNSAVEKFQEDSRLNRSYLALFGDSRFFCVETYKTVLKLRTWLDNVECENPRVAPFATIAVLASLVPASDLIRKGDLRFRKGPSETAAKARSVTQYVSGRLIAIADDLSQLDVTAERPRFLSGDAKRLIRLPSVNADAVVTSPPYLNGTNYYRNTKVELWFMRALHVGTDLAAFRRSTVTAGINDVVTDKSLRAPHPSVEKVLRAIGAEAYDQRIPLMVAGYFSDMDEVFDGVAQHLSKSGRLLLDIGDSAYAGVHVNTPGILGEILQSKGWKVREEITLRNRMSKSGTPLRQVLLVADREISAATRSASPHWKGRWARFKKSLPHQQGQFGKRNWGSELHSLCSYQGKMKPSLAHHLVKTFVSPGDRMVDPFGGVGTIPLEAALCGAHAWSFDISNAAVPIAAAKLTPASALECEARLVELSKFIEDYCPVSEELREAEAIRFNGSLPTYFHRRTFDELLAARRYFQKTPPVDPVGALIFSCLLHVLHGNRPYALSRRSHPITPFAPTGPTEYKSVIEKVREKVARTVNVDRGKSFVLGASMFQDATAPWPLEVDNLSAVITSPPFFDSTRFYLANWMRLWFSGWSSADFRRRPAAFVDERQKQDFRVYEPVLRQARERLTTGGVCVLHLGKSKKCDMAERMLKFSRTWFSKADLFSESVEHCESHGIRDKGTVVEHTYLVLY